MSPAGAEDRLALMLQPDADGVDLALGALLIAADHLGGFDVGNALARYEALVAQAAHSVPDAGDPRSVVSALNQFFFVERGWRGAVDDYFSPRCCFVNDVMDSGRGIAETLSIPYLGALQRLGLPSTGLYLPGQYLVRVNDDHFVDVFDGGRAMDRSAIRRRIRRVCGHPETIAPISLDSRAVLLRILAALKTAYMALDEQEHALRVVRRILQGTPKELPQLRDRGLLHHKLGHWWDAVDDLSSYLTLKPDALDSRSVRRKLHGAIHLAFRLN